MTERALSVVVMGAGCIGAWVGARLAHAGAQVTLVGRPHLRDAILQGGLIAQTLAGDIARPDPTRLTVTLAPDAVENARLVIVSVKGRDTTSAARIMAPHLHKDAVLVSLQNGLHNAARIQSVLPEHEVVAGMVPFNVIWEAQPPSQGVHLRQATSGDIVLGTSNKPDVVAELIELLTRSGVGAQQHPRMTDVQWAKLVLNLNNAVHALSGLSLRDELQDRGYRGVLAEAMNEAWRALDAAGIRPAAVGRMRPRLAPWILPLPDALFKILAAPMIRVDPVASSSMADDLDRRRPTEVDDINGEVVKLARAMGLPAPVNTRLVALIHEAEARAHAVVHCAAHGRHTPGMAEPSPSLGHQVGAQPGCQNELRYHHWPGLVG